MPIGAFLLLTVGYWLASAFLAYAAAFMFAANERKTRRNYTDFGFLYHLYFRGPYCSTYLLLFPFFAAKEIIPSGTMFRGDESFYAARDRMVSTLQDLQTISFSDILKPTAAASVSFLGAYFLGCIIVHITRLSGGHIGRFFCAFLGLVISTPVALCHLMMEVRTGWIAAYVSIAIPYTVLSVTIAARVKFLWHVEHGLHLPIRARVDPSMPSTFRLAVIRTSRIAYVAMVGFAAIAQFLESAAEGHQENLLGGAGLLVLAAILGNLIGGVPEKLNARLLELSPPIRIKSDATYCRPTWH